MQRESKSGKQWTETQIVADVGTDITQVTDAPGSGRFRYRVLGYNNSGQSAWSEWSQIKVQ